MESIQQQITTLARKVDRIYQVIDKFDRHVFENLDSQAVNGEDAAIDRVLKREDLLPVSTDARQLPPDLTRYRRDGSADRPHGAGYRHDTPEWVIAQQDVSINSTGGMTIGRHQIVEQDLAPQVQIQRLTAQLTAAYNRIAALEEQLLAKRWK
jgi:hypothetical protein